MNNPNHKFTFRYQYDGCDQIAPVDITFEIPADVTLTQLLSQIESFLRASSFYFDGDLQIVKNDEWDKICIETEEENLKKLKEWNEDIAKLENDLKTKRDIEQQAYERASRNAAVVKNNWVHGICNPPSPDWKKQNEKTY